MTRSEPGQNANPIVSLVVASAIGYVDALTAQRSRIVNQEDHQAAVKALRAALGNSLPTSQVRRVSRILQEKDQAQYGARTSGLSHAQKLLAELDELAAWAEVELSG